MLVEAYLSCCLCSESKKVQVQIPEAYGNVSLFDEKCLCEKHSPLEEWINKQCKGCVAGWADCSLWDDFQYKQNKLTKQDMNSIQQGICPRRVNGSISVYNNKTEGIKIEELDDSNKSEVGVLFYNVIMEFREKNCSK